MPGSIGQTHLVSWTPIKAGQDYLEQYSHRPPVEALAELIWNGLDAESPVVQVDIHTQSLSAGDKLTEHVERIVVSDSGHGITPETASEAFGSLGDSWKKTLNGRTLNGQRVLHGRNGRGRIFAYGLGYRITWTSVSHEDGAYRRIQIEGDSHRIKGYEISDPVPCDGPTGTVVEVLVDQNRSLSALLRDDLQHQLAARLAPHLLGNPDIVINVNGIALDPAALVDAGPIDIPITDIPESELTGGEPPVLTVIDWKDEVRSRSSLMLCNEGGASLLEVDGLTVHSPLKSTGYLRWSRFGDGNVDLLLADLTYPGVMSTARQVFAEHIRARTAQATASIVQLLKTEGAYPYADEPTTPVEATERQMYDLVLVAARPALITGSHNHRAMSARLLKLALEERPDSLDAILSHTLKLTVDEQHELAEMLRYSPLGSIVGAAAEVARRLDLIATLRQMIYDPLLAHRFREVDQLHPLVKDNVWLFGEEWRLSRSEVSLTTILRKVLKGKNIAVEQDLIREGTRHVLPATMRGRVDLLLQRSFADPRRRQHLVVELKRPSTQVGEKALSQVNRYARALAEDPGASQSSQWTFWVVGSKTAPEIEPQITQKYRQRGHAHVGDRYDIWVTTWGELLDNASGKLSFYQELLHYDINQEQAVERVRLRHEALLPPAVVGQAVSSRTHTA